MIPLTPGGLGTVDAALTALLVVSFGMDQNDALAATWSGAPAPGCHRCSSAWSLSSTGGATRTRCRPPPEAPARLAGFGSPWEIWEPFGATQGLTDRRRAHGSPAGADGAAPRTFPPPGAQPRLTPCSPSPCSLCPWLT
jgi:hypothetical protein